MTGDPWTWLATLQTYGIHMSSGIALGLGAAQDLAQLSVTRLPLFLLYGLGIVQGVDVRGVGLWLLCVGCGAMMERRDKVPLGEGDFYVIGGLALFHSAFDLLIIVTLAVWILLPRTIYALWLKHKGQPYRLPFVPALFVARQIVMLSLILV